MAKRKLSEAAAEILGGNVAAKEKSGEAFGAGATASGVKTPDQSGKAEEKMGDEVSLAASGIAKAVAAAPKATPPGPAAPVGAEPKKSLKTEEKDEDKDEDEAPEDKKEDDDDEDQDESDRENMKEEPEVQAEEVKTVSEKVKEFVQSKAAVNVAEDVDAIFAGESLSEDFKKRAKMVYEAAVISTATKIAEDIETEYATTLEAVSEKIKTDLSEQVDEYLNYMVEEWVKDNEIAVEMGLRAELTEDFISGLRNLFAEHYIDIPEDKVNVVEELADKVDELETKLNEQIATNVAMNKTLAESKKSQVIANVCESLTETQKEKIKSLAEGVEFTSEKDYTEALNTLRENYFPAKAVKAPVLDEVAVEGEKTGLEEQVTVNPEMDIYVNAIRKTLK